MKNENPIRQAAALVTRIQIEMWVIAGLKRYAGQAKLKRIENYLWMEAVKAETR